MHIPDVIYPAVLVSGLAIFMLGALWYSVLFKAPWTRLMGKTEEELRAGGGGAGAYVIVFIASVLTAYTIAVLLNHFPPVTPLRSTLVAILCWAGFTGATSFGTALFSSTPRRLWMINTGYNLVSFIVAALILTFWRPGVHWP
jgi:hypothetical protein